MNCFFFGSQFETLVIMLTRFYVVKIYYLCSELPTMNILAREISIYCFNDIIVIWIWVEYLRAVSFLTYITYNKRTQFTKIQIPSFAQTWILFTWKWFVPSLVEIWRRRWKCEKFMTTTTTTATTTTIDNGQILLRKAHISLRFMWANKLMVLIPIILKIISK